MENPLIQKPGVGIMRLSERASAQWSIHTGKLKRVDLAGGAATVLCEAQQLRGGSWSEDGVILFAGQQSGLRRVPASGGSPAEVTQLDKAGGETAHYFPQFLPGGKDFLYLLRSAQSEKTGTFLGGLELRSKDPEFGGISSGLIDADGRGFLAISDHAHWITGRFVEQQQPNRIRRPVRHTASLD